jgi:murein DD-endopeptidase MepM/ murein hydrolase activator NlpD
MPHRQPRLPRGVAIDPNLSERPSRPFHAPLAGATVLSPFGQRGRRFHTGIDLRSSRAGGDPVRAAREGRVIQAGTMRGYGRIVSIRHDDGFLTRYAHLKSIKVKAGQRVKTGEVVGSVGRTGRASTPHLHFETLTPSGKYADPAMILMP